MKHIYLIAALLFLALSGCKSTYYVTDTDVDYKRISEAEITPDQEVADMLIPYRTQMDAEMNEVIGHLDTILRKESPESNIGNWLSDMLLEEATRNSNLTIDFAVQNSGGIRVPSLAAGPITIGEVFEVMPFDNKISIITADGNGVKEFMDHMAKGRGWPISKGVSYKIKDQTAHDIMINGAALDLNKTYTFALPDYIAGGGSGSAFLRKYDRQDLELLIRESFVEHIMRDTESGSTQYAR
ncbi:MAG: 2',3'-cyclic-nucleotide 2'-phosphodiesterase (5'-nucleotidase family), partial [Saprospiraceae bacterium]